MARREDTDHRRRPRLGHLISTAALCVAYILFAYAHLSTLTTNGFRLSVALLVAFESIMVILVFFRRPAFAQDHSPSAVGVALLGSLLPLGLRPAGGAQDILLGQVVLTVGILGQIGSSLSIRRSFGLIAANRGVQTDGLYRIVRHPFYSSYLLAQLGYVISNPSTLNIGVLTVATGFQLARIWFEERLLMDDNEYRQYRRRVRWHLLPGLW